MRAVQVTEFGGPEVLTVTDLPDPEPQDGQHLLTVTGAGINYADTHQTEDTYLAAQELPFVPGTEVVGHLADGRRVAALAPRAYAEQALVDEHATLEVPDELSDGAALALLVQGATAWHLLRTAAPMRPGETVVVLAAAGGVGNLAVQLAKRWGAGRVIGCASTPDKRALAERLGADVTVDSTVEDLRGAIEEANDGEPVDVVLEMAGGPTFDACYRALAPFGRIALYGMASRTPATPIDPMDQLRTSKTVAGFWLAHVARQPRMLVEALADLFTAAATGEITPVVGGTYPLTQVHQAHEDLLARRTTGKLVLDPRQ